MKSISIGVLGRYSLGKYTFFDGGFLIPYTQILYTRNPYTLYPNSLYLMFGPTPAAGATPEILARGRASDRRSTSPGSDCRQPGQRLADWLGSAGRLPAPWLLLCPALGSGPGGILCPEVAAHRLQCLPDRVAVADGLGCPALTVQQLD